MFLYPFKVGHDYMPFGLIPVHLPPGRTEDRLDLRKVPCSCFLTRKIKAVMHNSAGIEAVLKFSCSFSDLLLKLDQIRSKIYQQDFTMNKCVFIDVKVQEGILHRLQIFFFG